MDYKTCNTCKVKKPINAFRYKAHNCMECEAKPLDDKTIKIREKRKEYRDKNKERVKARKDRWRFKNKERSIEYEERTKSRYREEIRARNRQKYKDDPYLTRRASAREKANKYGVRIERYHPLEIYERDKGICCVCLEWVDLSIPARDPMSFTIQHHISIRNGGADAPDNVGVAHYSCNSSIGNRGVTKHVK